MSETKVFFGVSLELAGKTISLEPKNAISELKEKGIEVELPAGERVYLGTVGTSIGSIMSTLGVDDTSFIVSKEEADNDSSGTLTEGAIKSDFLPDIAVLQNAADLVLEAGLYVDEFHVRIPGAATSGTVTKEKTAYTVGLSAEWQDDAGQLIDGLELKLKGVYFKVSNEE
ncbi:MULTISPECIES: hypothetical protein [Moorena]|uniref:Uncharacterized protein n=1 Tax=Moorena producens 3L TaxID=489825 RepID=F4XZW7_9CYAN|nr:MULTISPECIES: hypothetical protein [Moorena]EGJ29885.1 hypothetical protein LYNGBM3L_59120 [Moorena producens 3L]NEP66789.1 hypothetical protein [Moorena sp. SIO3A5]OLT66426.1 hypothetical protein BI334_16670 [Moorena producens 3L]